MPDPSLSKTCGVPFEWDGRCRAPVENHRARLRSERPRGSNEIPQALGAFCSIRARWLSRCWHSVTATWCLRSIQNGWCAGGTAPADSRTRSARLFGSCGQDGSVLHRATTKSVRPCAGRFFIWRGPGPFELGAWSHWLCILVGWHFTRWYVLGLGLARSKAPPPRLRVPMRASGEPELRLVLLSRILGKIGFDDDLVQFPAAQSIRFGLA